MRFEDLVGLGIIVLIVCVIVLFVWWKIAEEFYDIAVGKGHKDRKYFWYCFLLSFAGYLLVVALPDKTNMNIGNEVLQVVDELPEI